MKALGPRDVTTTRRQYIIETPCNWADVEAVFATIKAQAPTGVNGWDNTVQIESGDGEIVISYQLNESVSDAREEPVVHLLLIDPESPVHDDVFTRCCAYNWRALITDGLITGNAERATCKGRPA